MAHRFDMLVFLLVFFSLSGNVLSPVVPVTGSLCTSECCEPVQVLVWQTFVLLNVHGSVQKWQLVAPSIPADELNVLMCFSGRKPVKPLAEKIKDSEE